MFGKLTGACVLAAIMGMAGNANAAIIPINETIDIAGVNGEFTRSLSSSILPHAGDSIDLTVNFLGGLSLRYEDVSPSNGDWFTFEFVAPNAGGFTIENVVGTLFDFQTNSSITSPLSLATFTSGGTQQIGPVFIDAGLSADEFISFSGFNLTYNIIAWDAPVTLETLWLRQNGLTVSAVPLPAALPLMGSGLALLGLLGWRRRRFAGCADPPA